VIPHINTPSLNSVDRWPYVYQVRCPLYGLFADFFCTAKMRLDVARCKFTDPNRKRCTFSTSLYSVTPLLSIVTDVNVKSPCCSVIAARHRLLWQLGACDFLFRHFGFEIEVRQQRYVLLRSHTGRARCLCMVMAGLNSLAATEVDKLGNVCIE
jgi:hypothetical protein